MSCRRSGPLPKGRSSAGGSQEFAIRTRPEKSRSTETSPTISSHAALEPQRKVIKLEKNAEQATSAQEVLELREKIAQLQKDFEGACLYANRVQSSAEEDQERVKFLENLLDKSAQDDRANKEQVDELQEKLTETESQLGTLTKQLEEETARAAMNLKATCSRLAEAESQVDSLTQQLEEEKARANEDRRVYSARIFDLTCKLAVDNKAPPAADADNSVVKELKKKIGELSCKLVGVTAEMEQARKAEEQAARKAFEMADKEKEKTTGDETMDMDKKMKEVLQQKLTDVAANLTEATRAKEYSTKQALEKAQENVKLKLEIFSLKRLVESHAQPKTEEEEAGGGGGEGEEKGTATVASLTALLEAERWRAHEDRQIDGARVHSLTRELETTSAQLELERCTAYEQHRNDRARIDELMHSLAQFQCWKQGVQQDDSKQFEPQVSWWVAPAATSAALPAAATVKSEAPNNILIFLHAKDASESISYHSAVEQLRDRIYRNDEEWYRSYLEAVRKERFHCELCSKAPNGEHILAHFFSPQHAKKVRESVVVRADEAVVSLTAFEYWLRKLESIPKPTAAPSVASSEGDEFEEVDAVSMEEGEIEES